MCGHRAIRRRRPAEQIPMRRAAHQHDGLDREREGRLVRLRHVGEEAGALATVIAAKAAVIEPHFAGLGDKQAEQRLEQRGFAAAIRPEQRQYLARRQRYIEIAPDQAVAVADGKAAPFELHDQVRETLASSQMKNGVPTRAVRIPSGISIAATVRASVSITSRKPPPINAAAGTSRAKSGPTRERAMCGTTRPTQPIMPAVATLADVTKVAAATMATRSGPVGRPSALASSSGSDMTFNRQRSASSSSVPSATGTPSGAMSRAPIEAPITTPVSTSTRIGSRARTAPPMTYTAATATNPPTKANAWIANTPREK